MLWSFKTMVRPNILLFNSSTSCNIFHSCSLKRSWINCFARLVPQWKPSKMLIKKKRRKKNILGKVWEYKKNPFETDWHCDQSDLLEILSGPCQYCLHAATTKPKCYFTKTFNTKEKSTDRVNSVFHVFHVNISVNIFLLNRQNFYSVKIC